MTDVRVILVPGVTKPDRETGTMRATLPATWPKYDNAPRALVTTLSAALRGYADAEPFDPRGYRDGRLYIMQCEPMPGHLARSPRLATDAWRHHGGVRMRLLLTDIDATNKAATNDWWSAQAPALAAFLERYPGAFVARSRGGLRIYQVLTEPFVIDSLEKADEWKARYTAWVSSVDALPWVSAKVDGSCKDWARLQRVPHDTRDGVLQDLETLGNPENVGLVELPAPAPRRVGPLLRAYTGPTQACKVSRHVLEALAAVLPRAGDGVHESAMALGGVLAASHWATEDCVEVVEVTFAMAGLVREDIGRSARTSIDNARGGGRAYGWPRLRALLAGSLGEVNRALHALQTNVPGLERGER